MDLLDLLDDLLDAEKPAPVLAAPLHFTGAYFTPDELEAAHMELSRIRGAWSADHPSRGTWSLSITDGWVMGLETHSLCILMTDLRCECARPYLVAEWEKIGPCYCVGDLMFQANCPECRWNSVGTEREVVPAWHDHAFPGWRDLPIFPAELRGDMGSSKMTPARQAWLDENYPPEFRVPGAPILTERNRVAGRCVPGYSPYGGYDMGIVADQEEAR